MPIRGRSVGRAPASLEEWLAQTSSDETLRQGARTYTPQQRKFMRATKYLQEHVRQLEKNQRHQAGAAQNWDAYQFTATPTCPPSAAIFVRGGRMVWPASWAEGVSYYLSDTTLDFTSADASICCEWPYSFTTANWYLPIYVILSWQYAYVNIEDTGYGTPSFRLYGADYYSYSGGGFVEYETAEDAEAAIDGTNPDFYQDHMTEVGLPLCRVILRNSGVVDVPYQFMPVDMVNRGRSYLWGQFRNGRYTS